MLPAVSFQLRMHRGEMHLMVVICLARLKALDRRGAGAEIV